jgi:ABC-type lipoprotein export system ATPase subunit
MTLLRELAIDNGRAVVIVTHDERATAYADRIVTMRDGAVAADEAVRAVAGSIRSRNAPSAISPVGEPRALAQLRLAAG